MVNIWPNFFGTEGFAVNTDVRFWKEMFYIGCFGGLVDCVYGMSILFAYLMPNPLYTHLLNPHDL